MTPDQLITFAAVAETGSIGQAAEMLHLSQPAVSGQLRLLQETFGQPLYRRAGRGIALTPAGEQLAGLARALRQTYERARGLRNAMAGLQTGSLAIGASTTPASYLLPYVVADFRRRHPSIEVSLVSGNTGDIVTHLSSYDVAFIEGAVPPGLAADTAVRPWRRDEVVAIVPAGHALDPAGRRGGAGASARPKAVALAILARYPLVLREAGSGVRHQVTQAFQEAGLDMQIALELAGVEGVKEAVRAGLGVGFVSAMAVQHEASSLVALRVGHAAGIGRHIAALIPHADSLGTPARAFLALCFPDAGG